LTGERLGKIVLKRDQVLIVVGMLQLALNGRNRIEPMHFLRELQAKPPSLRLMDQFLELVEAGLVSCDELRFRNPLGRRRRRYRYTIDRVSLIDSSACLSDRFLSQVLNADLKKAGTGEIAYKSNKQFLDHWFRYVDALLTDNQYAEDHGTYTGVQRVSQLVKRDIDAKTKVTDLKLPLQRLFRRYALSEHEQLILIYILKESLRREGCNEGDIRMLVAHLEGGGIRGLDALSAQSTLRREGLIVAANSGGFIFDRKDYEVAPDIAEYLVNERKITEESMLLSALRADPLLGYAKSNTSLKNMVLPTDQMNLVKESLARFNAGSADLMAKWGIGQCRGENGRKTGSRMILLLHGAPGTGKTALAHAIAGELKRFILTTDVSRILGKFVGESEKNVSQLFESYDRLSSRLQRAPILLFNEADQLLSVRSTVSQSVDRMYNSMQNLLLERLERFSGILIATSNLIDNLDHAFSRRFDLKLELKLPDKDLRIQLWRQLLPPELPLHREVDLCTLASRFALSGGQIETVIHNAAVAAAARKRNSRVVRQNDLETYAALEVETSFEEVATRRIGFGR
jgi:hypothetical protein